MRSSSLHSQCAFSHPLLLFDLDIRDTLFYFENYPNDPKNNQMTKFKKLWRDNCTDLAYLTATRP